MADLYPTSITRTRVFGQASDIDKKVIMTSVVRTRGYETNSMTAVLTVPSVTRTRSLPETPQILYDSGIYQADLNQTGLAITVHDKYQPNEQAFLVTTDGQVGVEGTIERVLTFYADSADGSITSTDTTYATARAGSNLSASAGDNVLIVGQDQNGADNVCYEAFIYFDTSGIPDDATITEATLYLYGGADFSDTEFDIEVREATWSGSGLTTADWVAGADLGSSTLVASLDSSTWENDAYNALVNNSTNLVDAISLDGYTEFIINSSRHRVGNDPSSYEWVTFWSGSYSSEARKPKLIVTYSEASATVHPEDHDHDGSPTQQLLQANTHGTPDTDASTSALHHTIGTGAYQAAAGNHAHGGGSPDATVGVYTIEAITNVNQHLNVVGNMVLDDLADVDTTGATEGYVLMLNGDDEWIADSPPGGDDSLLASRTSNVAIANTETVVISTSIGANTLSAGDVYRFSASGYTSGTDTGSSIYRIRIGPTTLTGNIASTRTQTNTAINGVEQIITGFVTIRSVGSSGTIIGALVLFPDVTTPRVDAASSTVAIDTTATNLFEFTYISGDASQTGTFYQGFWEKV